MAVYNDRRFGITAFFESGRVPFFKPVCACEKMGACLETFSCFCPVIDHEFRSNIVKVSVDLRAIANLGDWTQIGWPFQGRLHKKSDLPVAQHFYSPGHSLEDVRVAVLKSGLAKKDSKNPLLAG